MRKAILTQEVLATIPDLVAQGLNTAAICERLGCKPQTLKVRCSQHGISLRIKRLPSPLRQLRKRIKVQLSTEATVYFRRLADRSGLHESILIDEMLEIIARDDLYKAVVDKTPPLKVAA